MTNPENSNFLRFSLRRLLIGTALAAMVMAGGVYSWRMVWGPWRRQLIAMEALQKEVRVDATWENDNTSWLAQLTGAQRVTQIRLASGKKKVSDRHINRLSDFHSLMDVTIVAPDKQASLAGLGELDRVLFLKFEELPNSKPLKHVGEMELLTSLQLEYADGADIDFEGLKTAQSIQILWITTESWGDHSWPFGKINPTRYNGVDFSPIGELSNLEHLAIWSACIDDEMVGDLLQLNSLTRLQLEFLSLSGSSFSDQLNSEIDYQLNDLSNAQFIEFCSDLCGLPIRIDEKFVLSEPVSIGPADESLMKFLEARGFTALCCVDKIIITTPEKAAQLRPNLTELKRRNPDLWDVRVAY